MPWSLNDAIRSQSLPTRPLKRPTSPRSGEGRPGKRRVAEQRGTVGGPVLTEWFKTPDLHKLEVYESLGGYSAARKVFKEMTATQVIDEVKGSGLRGRGGADFPTAPSGRSCPRIIPVPSTSSSTPTSRSRAAQRTAT